VGAVGVSTHAPEVVAAAAEIEDIDVIHPLVNQRGLGLLDGTVEEMTVAIERAGRAGKGIYAMKVLGGGHLAVTPENAAEAFAFVRGLAHIQAVAVGVKSREELLLDLALLEGRTPPAALAGAVAGRKKRLFIEEHCEGCGRCVEACRYGALNLVPAAGAGAAAVGLEAGEVAGAPAGEAGGTPAGAAPPGRHAPRLRAAVDPDKCVLCGYCAAACRDFYIKVI